MIYTLAAIGEENLMTWKPSEGLRRAHGIVDGLILDWRGVSTQHLDPSFCHRMTEVVAKALDQALADGDAMAWTKPNGHAEPVAEFPPQYNPHGTEEVPATADPVGFDERWYQGQRVAAVDPATLTQPFPKDDGPPPRISLAVPPEASEPKKARGRPKGAKGKKAKKAKAAKPAPVEDLPEATPEEGTP